MQFTTFDEVISFLETENNVKKVQRVYPSTSHIIENDLEVILYQRESLMKDRKLKLFSAFKSEKKKYLRIESSITRNLIEPAISVKQLDEKSTQFEKNVIIGGFATSAITLRNDLNKLNNLINAKAIEGDLFTVLNILFDIEDYFQSLQTECSYYNYYLDETVIFKLVTEWIQDKKLNLLNHYKNKFNRDFLRLKYWQLPCLEALFGEKGNYEEEIEKMYYVNFLDRETKKATKHLSKEILAGIIKHWRKGKKFLPEYNPTNERLRKIVKNEFNVSISQSLFDRTEEYDMRTRRKHQFPK